MLDFLPTHLNESYSTAFTTPWRGRTEDERRVENCMRFALTSLSLSLFRRVFPRDTRKRELHAYNLRPTISKPSLQAPQSPFSNPSISLTSSSLRRTIKQYCSRRPSIPHPETNQLYTYIFSHIHTSTTNEPSESSSARPSKARTSALVLPPSSSQSPHFTHLSPIPRLI